MLKSPLILLHLDFTPCSYIVGPSSYKWVYKPHEYYSYVRIINHSEIGVMFTKYLKDAHLLNNPL